MIGDGKESTFYTMIVDIECVANLTYRAETLVVKLAHSFAYKSLVVPVMSSHWAGAVPPTNHTG